MNKVDFCIQDDVNKCQACGSLECCGLDKDLQKSYDVNHELNKKLIKYKSVLEDLLDNYTVRGEDAYNLIQSCLKLK